MPTRPTQPSPEDPPAATLDQLTRLRRRTRAQSRGAWFPLTMFALLTLASTLLYQQPFFTLPAGGGSSFSGHRSGYAGLPWSDRSAALSLTFWLVAAPLCYLGCALWYRRRAQQRGLSLRWQAYVATGLALLAALALALVAQHLGWLRLPGPWLGGQMYLGPRSALSPLLAIALGLLALARVERSWGVAVVAILYGGLATVMNLYGLGEIPPWIAPPLGGSSDALVAAGPNLLLLATILLLGAAAVGARTARAARHATPETASLA